VVVAEWVIALLAAPLALILLVRFRKRQVAAFHRAITNRVAIRFAARLPGFGIVTSVGRRSGAFYRTPVNVFRELNGFRIALTYGRDSGWVKNVLAAGGCQLETRRVTYQLSAPVIVHDPSRKRFPLLVRIVLGLIDANDFLTLVSPETTKSTLSPWPSASRAHRQVPRKTRHPGSETSCGSLPSFSARR
jgi:deazaflavin-dependent oxidoreductase (nitroreductase family)